MALWPFSRIWPGALAHNQVVTHSELNKLDEQLAQAADGSIWTDVAIVANQPILFTDALGGEALLYNPVLDRFFSFGHTSPGTPTGFSAITPFTDRSALTIPLDQGLTLFGAGQLCAVNPTTGMMVLGSDMNSSSQLRYRTSSDGVVWASRSSAIAASTSGPRALLWAGGPFNKFFSGSFAGWLESSPDGITWTAITMPDAAPRRRMAFSPTLPLLVTVSASSTTYATSPSGGSTSFTNRTSPVVFDNIFWSAFREKFFASELAGGARRIYSSDDGVNWVASGTAPVDVGQTGNFFEWTRLIGFTAVSGEIVLSYTGTAWKTVAKAAANGGIVALSTHPQLVVSSGAGAHAASLRFGL